MGWSRVTVWMGRDMKTGNMSIFTTRCPHDLKLEIIQGSQEFFQSLLRHPMLIHLKILQSVAYNHWQIVLDRFRPLYHEVKYPPPRPNRSDATSSSVRI